MDSALLAARIEALPQGRRVVALAGPPGAGKSTAAEGLAAVLPSAMALPVDGYHYDDAVLRARGLLARKGAPETFDVGGLAHMLDRLRRGDEAEVVRREEGQRGFAVQPRRRVVERTFAWLGRSRRLAKDHERRLQSAEAMIKLSMIHLMLRRLT